MIITSTAIAFSLSSLGLAFCGFRFFNAFQKIGGPRAGRKIGILLSALHLTFAFMHGILATGILFFAKNPEILYRFVLAAHFLVAVVATLGIYSIFYIFFPSTSPWLGVISTIILGISLVLGTIVVPPNPFIDIGGAVDLNLSRWLSILLSYLLFIGIGSFFAIFSHSLLWTKSREVKVVSFVLTALALIGIVNVFTRFLLPAVFSGDAIPEFLLTRIFDIVLAFIGIVFIAVFVFPPVIIKLFSKDQDH